jgi:hypothetical protein
MMDNILGFDLNSVGDSEISEPDGVRLGVYNLLDDLFSNKEVKFF